MSVAIRADREGNHARLVATGPFDLAHATMAARAVENAEALLANGTLQFFEPTICLLTGYENLRFSRRL
jgi:hypothetical protein